MHRSDSNYWSIAQYERAFIDVIEQLNDVFDSHRFIEILKSIHPEVFEDIAAKNQHDDQQTNAHIANLLSRNIRIFSLSKIDGDNTKVKSENVHGNITTNQLWRKLLILICMLSLNSPLFAQLKIEKLNMPQELIGEWSEEPNPYARVMFNFSQNLLRPVSIKNISDSNVEFTVWENDLSTIYRHFSVVFPQGYSRYSVETGMANIGGRFRSDECSLCLTQDLFNDDDLIEFIVYCENSEDKTVAFIMNENNEVLAQSDEMLHYFDHFLDPSLVGGHIYTLNGYTIYDESSGIEKINRDKYQSVVAPNPSNGASSITINMDYTLLNDATLVVIDMDGKKVHSQTIKSGGTKAVVATSRFAVGNYIYVIQNDNGYISTGKIIIN